ncbi:MAG: polymer-forming cytoskeletal protein [Acidobacteriia bacterium]|nr:polymer-forming cytoskeletal protein [Terriglobia bacterium]
MWNKRRDEEPPKPYVPPPAPVPAAPSPVEAKKEATPVSSMPVRTHEPENRGGSAAAIGKAVKIVGQIFSKEDLYVDGDLEGTVEALEHKVTIGPNGTLHAGIKAREVVALGNIQGNVEATDKIEIRKDAKLIGDIKTARIIIEDGAYFKGSIDIVKPEPKAALRAQTPAPAQAPVTASAGATDSKR